MPEGRRPEGTDCCPRHFFSGDEKTEVEAAISVYIARPDPIYIINIPLLCIFFKKKKDPLIGYIISGYIHVIVGHL